jgi:hypothetical protein
MNILDRSKGAEPLLIVYPGDTLFRWKINVRVDVAKQICDPAFQN